MGIEFYNTVMGRCFFDSTMPRIARALESIADKLPPVAAAPVRDGDLAEEVERLAEALRRKTEEAANLRQSTAELMRQRDEALAECARMEDRQCHLVSEPDEALADALAGIVEKSDMVHVACTECGAEYDMTRLHGSHWPPYCCGACGCRRVVVKPADIQAPKAKS